MPEQQAAEAPDFVGLCQVSGKGDDNAAGGDQATAIWSCKASFATSALTVIKKKPYIFMQGFDLFGGSSAARTRDHRIKSAVLYRLS